MNNIKLNKLTLENFKCHEYLSINFDERNVSIYGDNATGKTSVYDALTWLLFGKDSCGNGEKNIEIKPLDAAGEVKDHNAITSVEAEFVIDGETVKLKRTLQELWSTKRGCIEPTYDGNTSEYYIDGVPCKKNAYVSKVDEIVSEDTFRMLTNVSYFAKDMPWQKRREVLFNVSGVMSDLQIMETKDEFIPLKEALGKLSVEDYKKKLLAEKKSYTGTRNEIPARINECQKTINDFQNTDFAAAKSELEMLTAHKNQLSAQLLSIERNTATESKMIEIKQAQLQLSELDTQNNNYRAAQLAGSVNTADLKKQLDGLKNRLIQVTTAKDRAGATMQAAEKGIGDTRNRWMEINNESFTGGLCPTCGQSLPADQLKQAHESFEAHKQKRLEDVVQLADTYKQAKANALDQISRYESDIVSLEKEISEMQLRITSAESQVIVVTDMEGYADTSDSLRSWIQQLQEEYAKLCEDAHAAGNELRDQIRETDANIRNAMLITAQESTLQYANRRIEDLRNEAAEAAKKLQSIESMLFLIDEFTRYKTSFVEESINSCFRIARFRLFREQANGGVEDRCDVVHDGVPYISVNNGTKINLGIDIINTLSVAYGVSVPLFVDNAESVTHLEKTTGQIIRLVVSENDKELRVAYEN